MLIGPALPALLWEVPLLALATWLLLTLSATSAPAQQADKDSRVRRTSALQAWQLLLAGAVAWHLHGQARALGVELLDPDAPTGFVLAGLALFLAPPAALYGVFRLQHRPSALHALMGVEAIVLLAAVARLALYRDVPRAWQALLPCAP